MASHPTSPFVIGVAGGSGSGKSTVVNNLVEVLKGTSTVVLRHDNYYCDQSELPMDERVKTNYDHPDSLETSLLVKHIRALRDGKSIEEPAYDFVNHTRSSTTTTVHPASVIIVEGILIFEHAALREEFALKVFVDTDDDLRLLRRLQRDISERGRTVENVIDQYLATVRPMYQQFVWPSKRFADVIIPEGGFNQVALDLLLARVREIHHASAGMIATSRAVN
jgi:uridine kinase